MPVEILRQLIIHAALPLVGKLVYFLLLFIVKKLLKALKWLSLKTGTKLDDELVQIMERALKLQEQEPPPEPPNAA